MNNIHYTGWSKKKFTMWSRGKVLRNSKIFFDGVFLSIYSHLVKKFKLSKLCMWNLYQKSSNLVYTLREEIRSNVNVTCAIFKSLYLCTFVSQKTVLSRLFKESISLKYKYCHPLFSHSSQEISLIRGVRSRGAQCAYAPPNSKQGGHMPPPESMPPLKFEIVCFCPSWKKMSGGADGADSLTPLVTSLLLIFSCTPKIQKCF